MREINQAGLDLIKHFEGLYLKAYLCPAKVWTIGYGHTGPEVNKDSRCTNDEAEVILFKDLAKFCRIVADNVKVSLTDNQFSALVSFCFNIGENAFKTSTLLRRLNEGKVDLASEQFVRWDKVNGKPIKGLTFRRSAEQAFFNAA